MIGENAPWDRDGWAPPTRPTEAELDAVLRDYEASCADDYRAMTGMDLPLEQRAARAKAQRLTIGSHITLGQE